MSLFVILVTRCISDCQKQDYDKQWSTKFQVNGDNSKEQPLICHPLSNHKAKHKGGICTEQEETDNAATVAQSVTPLDYSQFLNSIAKKRKPSPLRELSALIAKLPPETISLCHGLTDNATFPICEITVHLKCGKNIKINGSVLQSVVHYLPSSGYMPLTEVLKNLQDRVHGKRCWEKNMLLTTCGAQEGMCKTVEMCMCPGDPVIIQHPIYAGAIDLFRPYEPDFILAQQDSEGVQPKLLRQLLEERVLSGKPMPKLMYINPTAANPTGTTLPIGRKIELYKLACAYNFLILEDDAYFYVDYSEETPKSFLSLDTEGRVIRFDSFSKIFSPGMRIGFVTGPTALLKNVELMVQVSSMHASSLSQIILHEILKTWQYEGLVKYLREIKQLYKRKKNIMIYEAEKYLKDVAEWSEPSGGMFLWLRVKGIDDVRNICLKRCIEKSLVVTRGHVFTEDIRKPSPYIRLSFSSQNSDQIEKGVKLLKSAITEEIKQKNVSDKAEED